MSHPTGSEQRRERLDLGERVDCTDDTFGELVDVVIDPTTRRLTHLVVEPHGDHRLARLVPIALVQAGESGHAVRLGSTLDAAERLPLVHRVDYLRLLDFPVDDPDWDVGIEEVLALPYYFLADAIDPPVGTVAVVYDRIPKHEVEIRRATPVYSVDGHCVGHVDGLIVDESDQITHLVLERGHLWGRRELTVPIGSVAQVATDRVELALAKSDVGDLPTRSVRRWPQGGSEDS